MNEFTTIEHIKNIKYAYVYGTMCLLNFSTFEEVGDNARIYKVKLNNEDYYFKFTETHIIFRKENTDFMGNITNNFPTQFVFHLENGLILKIEIILDGKNINMVSFKRIKKIIETSKKVNKNSPTTLKDIDINNIEIGENQYELIDYNGNNNIDNMNAANIDNLFGFQTKFYYNDDVSKKELIAQRNPWAGSLKAKGSVNGTVYKYNLKGYNPIVIKGSKGNDGINFESNKIETIKTIIEKIKGIDNVIKIKYLGYKLEKNDAIYDFRSNSRWKLKKISYYFYAMPLYDGNLTKLLYDENLTNDKKEELIGAVKKIIVNTIKDLMDKNIIPVDITFDNILYKKNSDETYKFCLIDIDLWQINNNYTLIDNYNIIINKRIDYILLKIITKTSKDELYNTIHTNPPIQIEEFDLNYNWTLEEGIINYSPNNPDTTNTLPLEASIALDSSPSDV